MSDHTKTNKHYLAEGSVIEGKLTVDTTVTIDGTIIGSVESSHEVVFEKKGVMEGPIRAHIVKVKGSIKGDIFSNGKVEVLPGGFIEGNVTTPPGGILVRAGGVLNSQLATFKSGTEKSDLIVHDTKNEVQSKSR
ncbi:MAG: polymer-forming cytoskeletal protein [SAR324 cluster bacterium]|nr:polymer-forming cytoskeletal protein [SAR324 cluster bacterium]